MDIEAALVTVAQIALVLLVLGAASGLVSRPEGVYFPGIVSLLAVATFAIVRFLFARPAA